MEDFEEDVIATRMPCLHIFHAHCILRCLESDHRCPFCRDPLPHDDAYKSRCHSVCRHPYYTEIESKPFTPAPPHRLQIRFSYYTSILHGTVADNQISYEAGKFHLRRQPHVLRLHDNGRKLHPTMITPVLTSIGVPRHEQPPIVAKIFETFATNNDDGGAFINVNIYRDTVIWPDGARAFSKWVFPDSPYTNDLDTRIAEISAQEELYGKKPRPKPATKSAIEGLERVRVDKSCGICKDKFEEGLLTTRFPCLHIFHAHCILSWLETDHKCPLCRYPLLLDPSNVSEVSVWTTCIAHDAI